MCCTNDTAAFVLAAADEADAAYNEGYRAGTKDAAVAAGKAVTEAWNEAHREGFRAALEAIRAELAAALRYLEERIA
jgi:flagellar biosynthesis/type III secretory pathway protein FliH